SAPDPASLAEARWPRVRRVHPRKCVLRSDGPVSGEERRSASRSSSRGGGGLGILDRPAWSREGKRQSARERSDSHKFFKIMYLRQLSDSGPEPIFRSGQRPSMNSPKGGFSKKVREASPIHCGVGAYVTTSNCIPVGQANLLSSGATA